MATGIFKPLKLGDHFGQNTSNWKSSILIITVLYYLVNDGNRI